MKLTRRAFTAGLIAAPSVLRSAGAAPLPPLPNIAAGDATFVLPGSSLYDATLPAYNLRTELRPALRILARTPRGMAQAIDWLRTKDIAFALRSGGHCFEGFSQSTGVVLDTRLMNAIALDTASNTLTVGAGTSLGEIYKFVAPRGLAFPGGSCPTVGVCGPHHGRRLRPDRAQPRPRLRRPQRHRPGRCRRQACLRRCANQQPICSGPAAAVAAAVSAP